MAQETLQLTTEQRLATLERENVVLRDKMKMLHGMLRQQRQLVNEYITQNVLLTESNRAMVPADESIETVGHFLCQRRFEQMEERLEHLGTFLGEAGARRQAV